MSKEKLKPALQRDTSLDKELPGVGYHWVPASMNGGFANFLFRKDPNKSGKLGLSKKKMGSRVLARYDTPSCRLLLGTHIPLFEAEPGDGKIVNLGKKFLRTAKYSLYGANDAPINSFAAWRDDVRANSYVIQDSGGFQIATGVVDFLDPVKVAKAHSLYADSGVCLDIPTFKTADTTVLKATAKVLVANNEIMAREAHKSVSLLNVCHGGTLKLRLDFLKDIGKGPPMHSLCIGGLRQSGIGDMMSYVTPERFAAHVLLGVLYTEKLYEHYHVLGVATDWQMALMALISDVTGKKLTSDSATHNLSGAAGVLVNYGHTKAPSNVIGQDREEWGSTRCSCPACQVAEYEVVHRLSGTMASLHNGFALASQAKSMRALVKVRNLQGRSRSEFSGVLYGNVKSLGTDIPMQRSFHRAVDLILTVKSYKDLAVVSEARTKAIGLFNDSATGELSSGNVVIAAIRRYEKYHKKSFLS